MCFIVTMVATIYYCCVFRSDYIVNYENNDVVSEKRKHLRAIKIAVIFISTLQIFS